jgi:hypothetical protein
VANGVRKGLINTVIQRTQEILVAEYKLSSDNCSFSTLTPLIRELKTACEQTLVEIDASLERQRAKNIDECFDQNQPKRAFKLLKGPSLGNQTLPPNQRCETVAAFQSGVDTAAAVLRQAGSDRPVHPLCSADGTPNTLLTQPVEPTTDDIASALGKRPSEIGEETILLIKYLRERGPQGSLHLSQRLSNIMRETSLEEIQCVSKGWRGKAVGATGFRMELLFHFPLAYQQLFLFLINWQLRQGMCLTSLNTVLLCQIPKPGEGGHRGLAIAEDVVKVIVAIIMSRISLIQRGLPAGSLYSFVNKAYTPTLAQQKYHCCWIWTSVNPLLIKH